MAKITDGFFLRIEIIFNNPFVSSRQQLHDITEILLYFSIQYILSQFGIKIDVKSIFRLNPIHKIIKETI